ncbi:insulinase family protein [Candidatus Aminicenantes bacterium AC-335-K20]|jgi:zinc protease|nr:insulinase family protein [SCandidatus Aminicenantes bacterium Aminicenantia_JdfR_composite]MCP2619594.1 insulinase family protein [Candidatus Aminicenantes bacterium AC-335-K20]
MDFLKEFSKLKKVSLPNGLKIVFLQRKNLPLINMCFLLNAGAVTDSIEKEGISSLTFELLFKGTKKRTAFQIANEIDSAGAILTCSTGLDYSLIIGEFLSKDMRKAFEILSDITLNCTFPPKELEKIRKKRIDKLKEEKDNPSYLASKEFFKNLFNHHPYGNSILGRVETISTINERDIFNHYWNYANPRSSILSLVGDFDDNRALKLIEEFFGKWDTNIKMKNNITRPPRIKGRKIIVMNKPEMTQSQIRLGNIGFPRGHSDYFPAIIANTILGGSFTSRLVSEIRVKRGLTYHINSNFSSFKMGGAFYVSTFTENKSTFKLLEIVLSEMRKMREFYCSDEEIEKAKKYIKGIFPLKFETNENIALLLAEMEFYDLKLDFIIDYYSKLDRVSKEEVNKIANKYFDWENFCLFILGNAEEIKNDIKQLGEIKILKENNK